MLWFCFAHRWLCTSAVEGRAVDDRAINVYLERIRSLAVHESRGFESHLSHLTPATASKRVCLKPWIQLENQDSHRTEVQGEKVVNESRVDVVSTDDDSGLVHSGQGGFDRLDSL